MNKKFAVINNNIIRRVVVCRDPSLIYLGQDEKLIEAGVSKIRKGQYVEERTTKKHRRSYKDMIIGAAIAGGIGAAAAAIQYFL